MSKYGMVTLVAGLLRDMKNICTCVPYLRAECRGLGKQMCVDSVSANGREVYRESLFRCLSSFSGRHYMDKRLVCKRATVKSECEAQLAKVTRVQGAQFYKKQGI